MESKALVPTYDSLSDAMRPLIDGAIAILDAKGLTKRFDIEQCRAFVLSCMATGTNPLLGEVYPIAYWDTESKKYNLGTIFDYKVFLSRAERSGQLDGWETAFSGEVVKKAVQKTRKVSKNGSDTWEKYDVMVIDPAKTTLSGTIKIWRKDWGRPYKSRPLALLDEYKDTPFWHGDPYGMLEKALIREFFQKIFPKDCDLPDHSKESRIVPDYEVVGTAPAGIAAPSQPQPTKPELVNLMREVTDAMNAFSMPSTERDAVKKEMAEAYQKGNGQHLADMALRLREKAQEMLDKSHAARKPMPDPTPAQEAQDAVIVPNPPEERPEEALKASLVDAIIMLMNAGKYEVKHVLNSLRKNFPALVDSLSGEDTDWKAAIWSCTVDNELITRATEYYADAYKREIKKAAKQPAPAKEKPAYDSAAMLKIIDGILTREEWDLESDFHSDIAALLKDGSEEACKAIMQMIGAKAGDITKVKALLDRHSLTLQDMGIFGDVQPEHLGKKEIGPIIYELESRK